MPRSSIKAGDAGKTRRLQQQHREDDRRRGLELVDEDRENSAVCLHRPAAGDNRHCVPLGGQQSGSKD